MGIFIILVCLIFAYFAYRSEKLWYNPATIMLLVWAFILSMYTMRLYGLYEVKTKVYLIIAVGLLSFFAGYIITSSANPVKYVHPPADAEVEDNEKINYGILKICGLVVLAFLTEEAIETFILLRSGVTLFDIRTSLQGYAEYEFSEQLTSLRTAVGPLYTWFIMPVYNALLIMFSIDFFSGKRDKGLIFITLGCLLMKSLKEGSRVTILIFIIFLIFSMAIEKESVVVSKQMKAKIRYGVIILLVIMIALSIIRISQGKKSLFEEIYLYFACCMPLFDKSVQVLDSSVWDMHTYGALSMYGVLQLPVAIISFFNNHIMDWYNAGKDVINELETFTEIRISDHSAKSNAFATYFYYFYRDAGMIGVILGSTAFGMVATAFYKNLKRKIVNGLATKRAMYFYLLIIQSLILSFVRIYFSVASFAFTFVYAFIFISKKKVVEKKEDTEEDTDTDSDTDTAVEAVE